MQSVLECETLHFCEGIQLKVHINIDFWWKMPEVQDNDI